MSGKNQKFNGEKSPAIGAGGIFTDMVVGIVYSNKRQFAAQVLESVSAMTEADEKMPKHYYLFRHWVDANRAGQVRVILNSSEVVGLPDGEPLYRPMLDDRRTANDV